MDFDQGTLEEQINNHDLPWKSKVANEVKEYLVDTSAKVGTYTVPMALMESSQGLELNQIIQSRTLVVLIDGVAAKVYGKALNYTREKMNPEQKSGMRGYCVDTLTMIGVYAPIYAGILCSVGVENKQIASATSILCGVLAVTARPFSKYVLDPWRVFWKTRGVK